MKSASSSGKRGPVYLAPRAARGRVPPRTQLAENPPHPGLLSASGEKGKLIRPDHLEHVFGLDLKIVAAAAGADDRAGQPGLVDAVLDHGLVDVNGDDLTERQPGVRLVAVGALQLDDLRQLAFE